MTSHERPPCPCFWYAETSTLLCMVLSGFSHVARGTLLASNNSGTDADCIQTPYQRQEDVVYSILDLHHSTPSRESGFHREIESAREAECAFVGMRERMDADGICLPIQAALRAQQLFGSDGDPEASVEGIKVQDAESSRAGL